MSVVLDAAQVDVGEWVAVFTGPVTYDLYYHSGTEAMRKVAHEVVVLSSESAKIPAGRENLPFLVLPITGETPGWGAVFKLETGVSSLSGVRLVVRNPRDGNFGSGVVEIHSDGTLPEDAWLILFVTPDTYEVRRRSVGVIAEGGQPIRARVGETWRDPATGLTIRIVTGDTHFDAGDSFRFDSKTVVPVRGVTTLLGTFGAFTTKDTTPPSVELAVVGQDFHDGDPIPPKPRVHALLSDDSGIDPASVSLLLSRDGADFQPVPTEQRTLRATPGSNQALVEWTPELEPGDYELRVTATDVEGLSTTKQMAFRVAASSNLRSALNYPNPFRTYTDIAIEATGEMDALSVTIYSLAGRVVRKLEHPPTAGFVRIRWDGRDSEGREVADGVYYARVRMTARGKTQTETIKLLKMK